MLDGFNGRYHYISEDRWERFPSTLLSVPIKPTKILRRVLVTNDGYEQEFYTSYKESPLGVWNGGIFVSTTPSVMSNNAYMVGLGFGLMI